MAHVTKFDKIAVAKILQHYSRERCYNDDVREYDTGKNYNLCEGEGKQLFESCMSWAYAYNSKQLKPLADVIVDMPADLPRDKQQEFFKATYSFLAARYGVEGGRNIVSAYVHLDEATPHLHFAFVPCVKVRDTKRTQGKSYKVCAKQVITKADLQTLHTDLQAYCEKKLRCPVHVLNGETVDVRNVRELKKLDERIAEFRKQCIQAKYSDGYVHSDEQLDELVKIMRENVQSDEAIHKPLLGSPYYKVSYDSYKFILEMLEKADGTSRHLAVAERSLASEKSLRADADKAVRELKQKQEHDEALLAVLNKLKIKDEPLLSWAERKLAERQQQRPAPVQSQSRGRDDGYER